MKTTTYTVTHAKKTATVTTLATMEQFTKPELDAMLRDHGVKTDNPISKNDLMGEVYDRLSEWAGMPAMGKTTVTSEDSAAAPEDSSTQDAEETDAAPAQDDSAATAEVEAPGPNNAPEGMVYCGVCKKHVPKASAMPTSAAGVFMCKKLCKPTTAAKAAEASAAAKAKTTKTPKAKPAGTGRSTLFANDHIITVVKSRNVKEGTHSYISYSALQNGMTVKEFCDAVDALNKAGKCGAITGRSELGHNVKHGFWTVGPKDETAAE